jgi:hypothetical protein
MSLRKSKPPATRNESFSLSYLANVFHFLISINFEPVAEGRAEPDRAVVVVSQRSLASN